MNNTKPPKNSEILAIRMTPQLLKQLNTLAQLKNIGTATMARMALTEYLKDQAPDALIGTVPNTNQPNNRMIARPSQQVQYNDDWDY